MEKKPKSGYRVRFSDCDLFGHLNNARYIDYFLNAREDHLKDYYDLSLQTYFQRGISWFVGGHEILYVKPAQYNENVCIQSSIIQATDDFLLVELVMKDEQEKQLKSVMWTKFIPVNVKTGRRENHPQDFMDFVRQIETDDVNVTAGIKERVNRLFATTGV